MEKSNLYGLIRAFSPVELRDVRKFINSPFFNQRQDLILLFEGLTAKTELEKQTIWQQIYGAKAFDDQKMRLLMSYLHNLLEQYIAVKELTGDPVNTQLHLALGYSKRSMNEPFERVQKSLSKTLREQPLRDLQYYQWEYRLQWENFQLQYVKNPTEVSTLEGLSDMADVAYLIQKLRIACLLTAHQSVYTSETMEQDWIETLVVTAERRTSDEFPAIQVYLECFRMLRYPGEEAHFKVFKQTLFRESVHFTEEELRSLNIWAINYCVKRLNVGDTDYFKELLELYKEGLSKGYLLENGVLSRFTYHNVVAAGLHTGELDWVRYFINEYKNRLDKRYRDSSFSFSLARLEYTRRNYGFVLELLQKANYRDPLLNLAAKTLLLKTYYELGEHELLQSHLDAMRNYIHRKRVIGYHRTNYLNIIRFTEKLLRLNFGDDKAVQALLKSVQQETVFTEKAYFEQILSA